MDHARDAGAASHAGDEVAFVQLADSFGQPLFPVILDRLVLARRLARVCIRPLLLAEAWVRLSRLEDQSSDAQTIGWPFAVVVPARTRCFRVVLGALPGHGVESGKPRLA